MSESFLSTIWYRVCELKPRLRAHVSTHRHRYRGHPWYVLHDHAAARIHRFTPAAYMLIGQMNGRRTVDDIWKGFAKTHDEDAPSQDDVIQLLSKLHQQDLIQYEGSPDVAELLERYNKQSRQLIKQNVMNPVSFRIPLWDPDAFLTKTFPLVRPLTGWLGLFLWLSVTLGGIITAFMNWDRLTVNFGDRILATENLLITLVTYPILKALHELAHGYLAKRWGAEVREMGIMFLVFFPVPYVDASAAAAFRSKWRRAAVSAGGIFVETAAAAVAVMVWANAESGLVSALAYNVMIVGGLSTVIVNGNPLLKFDGYYIFSDLIEIPNLSNRSNSFYGHLIQRYVFGAKHLREKTATWGERFWFIIYAPSAFVYRIGVMVGIALFIAGQYYFIGILLALYSVFNTFIKPGFKHVKHVLTAPSLRKVRGRAKAWTFGTVAVVIGGLVMIPLPLRTDSEGVIWLPEEAYVRAGTAGFVREVLVGQGTQVAPDTPLLMLDEPTLAARIASLEARRDELQQRLYAAEVQDRRGVEVATLELAEVAAELDRERLRLLELDVRAEVHGVFEPTMAEADMKGRYLNEGDVLGYVLPSRPEKIRVVVNQDDIGLVRERLDDVGLMLAGSGEKTYATNVLRAVPQAQADLPSPALGTGGGGRLVTDPSDPEGKTAVTPIFVLDLAVPKSMVDAPFGARVLVRFDLGYETAVAQGYRRVRQLFLRRFGA